MNNKIRSALILSAITVFAGCASVAVTNDAIEQRTAFALGIDQGSFSISDRLDEGVRTSYTVKTKAGKTYSCYVTGSVSVVGRVVSDAVCTEVGNKSAKPSSSSSSGKTGSASPTPACNALLKAAGKC